MQPSVTYYEAETRTLLQKLTQLKSKTANRKSYEESLLIVN